MFDGVNLNLFIIYIRLLLKDEIILIQGHVNIFIIKTFCEERANVMCYIYNIVVLKYCICIRRCSLVRNIDIIHNNDICTLPV